MIYIHLNYDTYYNTKPMKNYDFPVLSICFSEVFLYFTNI